MGMPLGGVDLNLLVTLRALLEEENVTHAGSRLGLSQPSMSIALGRLRRHYKDELLIRNGRGYCLTPLARALLPSVTESLRLVDAASVFAPSARTSFRPARRAEKIVGRVRRSVMRPAAATAPRRG